MSEETSPQEGQPEKRKNPLFGRYETSAEAEAEGRWYTPQKMVGLEGAPQFRIARLGGEANKRIQKEEEKLTREQRSAAAAGLLPAAVSEQLGFDKFVNACLLDWKNMSDENGNTMIFSKEAARYILKKLPDLTDELIRFAMRPENYNKAALESDAGN